MPADTLKKLTLPDLTRYFLDAASTAKREIVGAEYETIGVLAGTGAALPAAGTVSVQAVLDQLTQDHGWRLERAAGTVYLHRDGSTLSLEPGGQVEISTPAGPSVEAAYAAAERHFAELRAVGKGLGVLWLTLGVHPVAPIDSVDWITKERYLLMREYFKTKGRLAYWMMKMSASVQANFDFLDEADAATKMKLAARLAPIFSATFANSCLVEGKLSGYKSFRSAIWRETDADRSGLPECLFRDDLTFTCWTEYALDIPMFFVDVAGKLRPSGGMTFRRFMEKGFEGKNATIEDWALHLSTLFPEVRLKKWIELRSVDRVGGMLAYAAPAFMKILLYVACAQSGAGKLLGNLTRGECLEGLESAAKLGPAGTLGSRKIADWARDLYAIANSCAASNTAVTDFERTALSSLEEYIQKGECPADRTIREVESGRPIIKILNSNSI